MITKKQIALSLTASILLLVNSTETVAGTTNKVRPAAKTSWRITKNIGSLIVNTGTSAMGTVALAISPFMFCEKRIKPDAHLDGLLSEHRKRLSQEGWTIEYLDHALETGYEFSANNLAFFTVVATTGGICLYKGLQGIKAATKEIYYAATENIDGDQSADELEAAQTQETEKHKESTLNHEQEPQE